jgi:hypothetical protein
MPLQSSPITTFLLICAILYIVHDGAILMHKRELTPGSQKKSLQAVESGSTIITIKEAKKQQERFYSLQSVNNVVDAVNTNTKAVESGLSIIAIKEAKKQQERLHSVQSVNNVDTVVNTNTKAVATHLRKQDMPLMIAVLSRRNAFSIRQVIRKTWGKSHHNIFFVVGACCSIPEKDRKKYTCNRLKASSLNAQLQQNKTCEEENSKLVNEGKKYKDVIKMEETDVYRHLPQKVKFAYKWGLRHTNAQWFMKTDDDSVVRVDTLQRYLKKNYNSDDKIVLGKIVNGWGVPRSGKWAELNYKPNRYPKFPLGSVGHVVSASVASYITKNEKLLFNYQGEDVSIGIWLNESPLKSKIKWITSKHMTNNGNCEDKTKWVIGHNIRAPKMESCYKKQDEVLK